MINFPNNPPQEVRDDLAALTAALDASPIPAKMLDRNVLIATWNVRALRPGQSEVAARPDRLPVSAASATSSTLAEIISRFRRHRARGGQARSRRVAVAHAGAQSRLGLHPDRLSPAAARATRSGIAFAFDPAPRPDRRGWRRSSSCRSRLRPTRLRRSQEAVRANSLRGEFPLAGQRLHPGRPPRHLGHQRGSETARNTADRLVDGRLGQRATSSARTWKVLGDFKHRPPRRPAVRDVRRHRADAGARASESPADDLRRPAGQAFLRPDRLVHGFERHATVDASAGATRGWAATDFRADPPALTD